jgi:CoA:oxalate CoA-transferase
VLAALCERARTGVGRHVDVAMLDCQVATLENAIARFVATGAVPGPLGSRHPSIAPFQAFATRDGHVIVAAGNDALFAKLATALDRPELAADPRFRTNDDRTRNVADLAGELEPAFASRATAEWLAALEACGIPCGPLNDVAQVLADPQVRARNMVVTSDDPDAGRFALAGNPVKLSGVEDPATRGAAPRLDEHRSTLLAELDEG